MDMRFGKWKARSLSIIGSLMRVAKEIPKYKLHLLGVQEVRRVRDDAGTAANLHFSMERRMRIIN
jgi:hypothetical protein